MEGGEKVCDKFGFVAGWVVGVESCIVFSCVPMFRGGEDSGEGDVSVPVGVGGEEEVKVRVVEVGGEGVGDSVSVMVGESVGEFPCFVHR